MPCIKDKSTVEVIARIFTSNGRCKGLTLSTAGYSDAYALEGGRGCDKVFSNVRVKEAIARIDAETKEKLEHNREIAIKLLTENLEALKTIINKGGVGIVGAVSARTAVIRELDAISMLHSTTVITEIEEPKLTEEEKAILKPITKNLVYRKGS